MKIRPGGAEFFIGITGGTYGRTDMKKLIGAFRYFAKSSENFTLCPHHLYFYMDLGADSDYISVHHYLVGFDGGDGVCFLRGTNWTFKCSVNSR